MSVLGETLKRHRRRLIEREEAAFRELLEAYAVIEREINAQIRELQRRVAAAREAGQEISPAWFSRERRLRSLLDQVKGQIERFGQTAAAITSREQRAAIRIASEQTAEMFRVQGSEFGVRNLGATLPTRVVEDAVGMMGDGSPILEYYRENLAPKVAQMIRTEVIKAAALGTDFRTVANRLMKTGQIVRSRALMVARTEVNRVRREATRQSYIDSGVATAWEWVASISPRTCAACLALDGRIFKLTQPFPQHPNCRCTMIPVIDGFEAPARLTGKEWFEDQPDDVKEKIIGKEGLRAYNDRVVKLGDFVGFRPDRQFGKSVYTKNLATVLADKAMEGITPTRGASVFYEDDAKDALKKLLGKSLKDDDVATLIGALDDSVISVRHYSNRVYFNIEHDFVDSHIRSLQRDQDGDLYFYNAEFFASDDAPKGLAGISFPRQASKALEVGVRYIKTQAIGNFESATRAYKPASGYFVWARFGYNADLTSHERQLFKQLLASTRPIRDINDVMLAGGKDEWFEHGSGRYMIFKLDGRTKSMKVLREYLKEKNARK